MFANFGGGKREGTTVLESAVEWYLQVKVMKALGVTYKFVSPGRRNVPDRIVIWPAGRVHFVEMKTPGKTARPAQVREHVRLRKMGCKVFVLDTKAKVDKYVRENA